MDTAQEKDVEARRPKEFDSDKGLLLVFKRENPKLPKEPEKIDPEGANKAGDDKKPEAVADGGMLASSPARFFLNPKPQASCCRRRIYFVIAMT